MFGNVFLPVDISSFTLPEDYWEEEEEEDEDEKEGEGGEAQPRTKKKRDPPEDHVIKLDPEKEVLLHSSSAEGIFYGQGALYTLLGIEPGETPILSSLRMRACRVTCHTTVFVRVTPNGSNNEELGDDVILAPHSNLLCIEVSKEEEVVGSYEERRLLNGQKAKELLCEGYHGGDLNFAIWAEGQQAETRLDQGARIGVSIGDHWGCDAGPAYNLIPVGFEIAAERYGLNNSSSPFLSKELANC